LTDVEFMSEVQPLIDRAMRLTPIVQRLFREWDAVEQREWRGVFSAPTAYPQLFQRHIDLHAGMDDERLRKQLAKNVDLYEATAVLLMAKALEAMPDVELDPTAEINAYAVSLDPSRWEQDGLFMEGGYSPEQATNKLLVRSFWMEQLLEKQTEKGTATASA
jgi:hypothetical protein